MVGMILPTLLAQGGGREKSNMEASADLAELSFL
jgi:hypothetical protein